jgi:hypothetical protein
MYIYIYIYIYSFNSIHSGIIYNMYSVQGSKARGRNDHSKQTYILVPWWGVCWVGAACCCSGNALLCCLSPSAISASLRLLSDDLLNKKKLNYKQQAPRSPVILISTVASFNSAISRRTYAVTCLLQVVVVRSKQFALILYATFLIRKFRQCCTI